MTQNRTQFWPGMSMPEFIPACGTEPKCAAALEQAGWPGGLRCLSCDSTSHSVIEDHRAKRLQCKACRYQISLTIWRSFNEVPMTSCMHQPPVVGGRKPSDLPQFQWINTLLGNPTTSLSGTHHACALSKYAARYLAAFAYRFNRRFELATLPQRLLIAVVHSRERPEGKLRLADLPRQLGAKLTPTRRELTPSLWPLAFPPFRDFRDTRP